MKTLREEWTAFFSSYEGSLTRCYPGLALNRFLMEVKDTLILRTKNPVLTFDQADISVSPSIALKLQEDFLKGIPFAYLTRFSEFYGRSFFVDERVLIPRMETELLVDHIVKLKKKFDSALDLGTGSGIILLSLLLEDVVKTGVGVDISSEVLSVAEINMTRHRLIERTRLVQSDRFHHVHEQFDLIVSNPPYIKEQSHRKLVHDGVHNFEPHLALYLKDDEYDNWFWHFFEEVKNHLLPGGNFIMEGHELELKGQAEMLQRLSFKNIQVIKDYSGFDRFLTACS